MEVGGLHFFSGELLDSGDLEVEQPYRHGDAGGRRILLAIDAGDGFEVWHEVVDFVDSEPDDPHFVVDHESGRIRFGDGRTGRRPPAGAAFRLAYRHGGGHRND